MYATGRNQSRHKSGKAIPGLKRKTIKEEK